MAVNKNFVVKNGLEVASDAVLVDGSSKNVGIGSTQPTKTLDVRGGIGATDIIVSGMSTFVTDVQVGASGSVFYVSNSSNNVGVGTSVPAYTLDVRGPVSTGTTALYVFGDMHVTGDINLDDTSLDQLFVAGISTLVGYSTFRDYVFIQDGLQVAGAGVTATTINAGVSTFTGNVDINSFVDISQTLNVGGITTIGGSVDINSSLDVTGITTLASSGGITTTGGNLYVGGDLFVADDLVYDEATARNWNVSGVATVGTLFKVLALSELVDLRVGGASTFVGQSQFNSNVSIGGSLSIAGITSLASTGGITTTGGDLFVGGSFNAKDIVVSGIATFGTTSVVIDGDNDIINVGTALTLSGSDGVIAPSAKVAGLSTFVGLSTFQNNVFVSGTLEAGLIDGGEY